MGDPHAPGPSTERHTGICKWFNAQKGFGFITVHDSDQEVFVHQSNIETTGYRSLQQGEEVEFDLVVGEDGKRKAFHVTGPNGAPPQGSLAYRGGYSGRGGRGGDAGFPPTAGYPAMAPGSYAGGYPAVQHAAGGPGGGRGRGGMAAGGAGGGGAGGGYWSPADPAAAAWGFYPMTAAQGYYHPMYARRGGFFPGGRNWVGARPPPPGQPGISSGLQVVVHNLPWDCTWQQLKEAFADCGEIDRADVVFDSRGRSRGFGIVRFPNKEAAEEAVEKMNNATIGGRVVSVRIDRFA